MQKIIWQYFYMHIVPGPIQLSEKIMALVIKILSKSNSKALPGIRVALTRPRIISREIPTKTTNSEGKVFFDLKSCDVIITINGVVAQKEQFLKDDTENVFYI
jgi:hypothetical protein